MAAISTYHGLFEPVRNIFVIRDQKRAKKGDKREFTTFTISVFIFRKGKLLLLQPTGESGWTVPSRSIRSLDNERRDCTGLIMQMLRVAIRTRTLEQIQFIDLAVPQVKLAELSATELHINVLLSVPNELKLDSDSLPYLPGKHQALQWVDSAAAASLQLVNLKETRLSAAFDQYTAIAAVHRRFASGHDSEQLYVTAFNQCKLAREMKNVWNGGARVDHMFVAVKEEKDAEGLFLIFGVDERDSKKYYKGEWTTVVIPSGYGGGKYPQERMDIFGEFQAKGGVLSDQVSLRVMLQEEVRLKMSERMYDRRRYFE